MLIRIISSVVGLPILVVLILLGGIWLQIGLAVLSAIGLFEFYRAVSGKIIPIHYIGFAMALIYLSMLAFHINEYIGIFINISIVLIMSVQAFFHKKINVKDSAFTLLGFFYIAYTLANIYIIRHIPGPPQNIGICTVWLVFISAWCCDTGAYFTGLLFGKHKLAPQLSPKKTIEGSIGGIVWAALGGALYAVYISYCTNLLEFKGEENFGKDVFIFVFAVISALSSIFAQIGDLAASAVKRYTKIKDFGSIMPGHGGVLDRFDSVIFTSAAVYVLINIFLIYYN